MRLSLQPAYFEIYPAYPNKPIISIGYTFDLGYSNAPSYLHCNYAYRFILSPNLNINAFADILENYYVSELAEVISSHHYLEYDGLKVVGKLTPIGLNALETLDEYLNNYPFTNADFTYYDGDNQIIC